MPIVRGQFDEFLAPGANRVFIDEYNKLPTFYSQMLNVDSSGRAFEEDLVSTGLGIATTKPEGTNIALDRPAFRGKVRYTHATYALGYEITREAIEDDLYGALVSKGSTNLAQSMHEAVEVVGASIFNNAFSTMLSYDGVPLISTAHPGVGGLTQANRPSPDVDFSSTALQGALEVHMTRQTDRGTRVSLMPTDLWVAPQGWIPALEILKAEFRPNAVGGTMGDETPNIIASETGLTPHWNPYLTDADAWFLINKNHPMAGRFYWRRKPENDSEYDKRAQIWWYAISARFSAGTTGWRWIYGSTGA